MTYYKAIEAAREAAKKCKDNYVVFRYPSEHWYKRWEYDYDLALIYETLLSESSVVKLLTITPDSTIAQ